MDENRVEVPITSEEAELIAKYKFKWNTSDLCYNSPQLSIYGLRKNKRGIWEAYSQGEGFANELASLKDLIILFVLRKLSVITRSYLNRKEEFERESKELEEFVKLKEGLLGEQ